MKTVHESGAQADSVIGQATRGPWRTQGWVPTWAYIPVHDANHNLVASLYPDSSHGYTRDQVEANAHLITAAPDMLAALKFIFEHIADKERGLRDLYPAFGLHSSRAIELTRDAIAKAEGRTP